MRIFRRLRPSVELDGYAAERGLRFLGSDGLVSGTRIAVPADRGDRVNLVHGRLPGGERGLLCHTIVRWSPGAAAEVHSTVREPWTIAAFPLPEVAGSLLRVTALPGSGTEPHEYMRRTTSRALPRHGTLIAPDGDDAVLDEALAGGAAAQLDGMELHVALGCLWIARPGFAERPEELDALATLGSTIARQARSASVRRPAAEFDAPLPPPRWLGAPALSATLRMRGWLAQGLDAPLWPPVDAFVPGFAAERGYVAEDPLTFHRSFPSTPLRGQAFAVFRGALGHRTGRLVVTTDVRLPEGSGMDAAVLPLRTAVAPTPPMGLESLPDGTHVAVGDGVFSLQRPREVNVLSGEALVELGARAAALADARGW